VKALSTQVEEFNYPTRTMGLQTTHLLQCVVEQKDISDREKEGMNPSGIRPFSHVVSGIPKYLHIRRGESCGRSLSEGNGKKLNSLL
jgi:hypothetical protein